MQEGAFHAALEPDQMRDYLLNDGPKDAAGVPLSRGGRLWCDRIIEGVARGERTAMRLFGEAMKWTGAQVNIAQVFIGQLGVRNESELKALVESGRQLEKLRRDGVSPESVVEEALEALIFGLRQAPELRPRVLARLGSYAEETNGSHTVEG